MYRTRRLIISTLILSLIIANFAVSPKVEAATKYAVTINVTSKAYGAKSGKDASAAIQKALDAAAKKGTAKKPALVKVPKGTYYLSKTLIIDSNTVLQSDAKTIYKKVDNQKITRLIRSKSGKKGGFSDTKNITINGGVWDSMFINNGTTTGGSTMFFVHASNLTIKNATVRNVYGTHLIELGGVKNCTIDKCTLYGFKASSNDIEKEAIQLDVCHDDRMLPDAAPFDDYACENITVKNCEVYKYSRAIGSHLAVKDVYHKNITISKNNFHDLKGAAVYGYNIIGLKVNDNKITNVGTGVLMHNCPMADEVSMMPRLKKTKATKVKDSNFKIVIENNEISAPEGQGDGKGIVLIASKEEPIGGCTVTGNKITADTAGMYLNAIVDSTFKGNTVNRKAGAGDANLSEYVEEGFKVNDCSRLVFEKNTVGESGAPYENGIAFRNGESNQVAKTNLKNLAKCGLAIYGSTVNATDITIDITGNNAVTISQKGTLTLISAKISNSKAIGVSATEESIVDMKSCIVTDCAKYGISASGESKITASECEASNNASYGVCSGKSSDVTLADSTVKNNGGTGVVVTESSVLTATGNTIESNTGFGISVTKTSTATVSGNKFSGNTRKDTYVESGSTLK